MALLFFTCILLMYKILKRDVRQGGPLSSSLFIIVLELLAISIRNNDQIRGIVVDGNEIKLVIFADDMTSFVRDKLSHRTLFDILKLFGTYSGLKVNHDKTEILLLGNMEINSSELVYKILFSILYWDSLNLVSNVVLKGSKYIFSQSNWDVCELKVSLYFFCAVGVLDILETKLAYNDFDWRF